jgi:hypothetical protein
MENMLKDVTFEDCDGRKHKQFVVRCMQRRSKYRDSSFSVLDILTNTFVLFQRGRSRETAENVLTTCTVDQYNKWVKMSNDGLKHSASRGV